MGRIRRQGRHGAPAGSRPPRQPEDQLLTRSVQALVHEAGGQRRDGTVRGRPRDLAVAVLREAGEEVLRLRAAVRELEQRPPGASVTAYTPMPLAEARNISVLLVAAARRTLDAHDAPNYVEQEVTEEGTGRRYAVIYVRPGGKTPSQLQAEAEARAQEAEARAQEAEARLAADAAAASPGWAFPA